MELFVCVWLSRSACLRVGCRCNFSSFVSMHFCPACGHMCIWKSARPCICVYIRVCVCVCLSQIHRDHVKDCVSYRCRPRTSGWHISNAQKGMRGGAKPQRRAVPQSLNSGGRRGGDQDCTTTAYTCSLHVCLPANQYSLTMYLCSAMPIHIK